LPTALEDPDTGQDFNPPDGPPYKQFGGGSGNRFNLVSLGITLGTVEKVRERDREHELVSNINLSSNSTFTIRSVKPCN